MSKGTIHFVSTDPRFCGNQDQVRQFSGYRDTITCLDCLAPKPLAFNIDRANSDDKRLYVGIPSRGMTAAIIITDEGVVVDLQVGNKLLASTHALTSETEEFIDDWYCRECKHGPIDTAEDNCPKCGTAWS